jgi:putative phage-type endonuclease
VSLNREEWLEQRRQYIGGSDAAAAIGMSRFKSQLELYQEKVGQLVDDDPTEAMIRGQLLESYVGELYQQITEHAMMPAAWIVSPDHPWMAATPDAVDTDLNSLVQIKTASAWARHHWGEDGSSKVPTDYMIQAQHEMAVTGARRNQFAVLFADNDTFRALVWMVKAGVANHMISAFIKDQIDNEESRAEFAIYPIERDDDLIATIVTGEEHFWREYVEAGSPPPDASIPEESSEFVKADVTQRRLIELLRKADEEYDAADAAYDEAKAQIVREIGENAGMVAEGLAKIHYKAPKAKLKTAWEEIAKQMRSSAPEKYDLLLKEHSETTQGKRVFRVYWK